MTIVLRVRTRRVRRQRDPAEPAGGPPPTADGVPRVTRMLALAHHWRSLIRAGVAMDQATLARLVGVSRARVTQVLDLLYLAPDIQEAILLKNGADGTDDVRHRDLLPIAAQPAWVAQRQIWRALQPEQKRGASFARTSSTSSGD